MLLPGCGLTGGQLAQLGALPQAGVQLGLPPLQINVWAAPHRFILRPRLRKAAVPREALHGAGRGTKGIQKHMMLLKGLGLKLV